MPASIDIKITGSASKLAKSGKARWEKVSPRTMLKAAELVASDIRTVLMRGRMKRSRGTLAESFRASLIRGKGKILGSKATSDLIYAAIQDRGGKIRPVRASLLFIPISDQAKRLAETGRSVRGITENLRNKRNGPLHYVFTKGPVQIPPKHYLAEAEKRSADDVAEVLGDAFTTSINSGKTT